MRGRERDCHKPRDIVLGGPARPDHRDLKVWRAGLELVTAVYRATGGFPREEMYGLTSQMRKAAVSVPANLAEGAARLHRREFLRFAGIARGSLMELETLWLICKREGIVSADVVAPVERLMKKTYSLLCGLIRSLRDPSS